MSIYEKYGQFAPVPYSCLNDKNILPISKLLYGILIAETISSEECTKKNYELAALLGITESTVARSLSQLIEQGYIKHEGGGHNRKIICLAVDQGPFVESPKKEVNTSKECITQEEYNHMLPILKTWATPYTDPSTGKKSTVGAMPRIKSNIQEKQPKTVLNINKYLKEAEVHLSSFFTTYQGQLDKGWMNRYGITLENIQKSTITLQQALRLHFNKLKSGDNKEFGAVVPRELDKFFIQRQAASNGNTIYKSWLLYWVCKDLNLKEKEQVKSNQPLTPKYPEEKNLYRAVGKAFGVNWNRLEKTPTELNNKVITLSEYIQEDLVIKRNTEMKHRGQFPVNHMFREGLTEFLTSKSGVHNFNPLQFIPGRTMWNQMIDYFKFKVHQEEHKHFELFYHPVKEFKVHQNIP